ncbi:MAG: PilZ domain-containing protein [Planctomycetes bacterium]|nr:PilZ domain-containing protein [Planctomycetota bacterium]MBM4081956.1 PilZ domain-containing protein [Planctomycetota bacterium]MBM4084135.1 PilZ domain-containing protein [Planctomycetota bacterium]
MSARSEKRKAKRISLSLPIKALGVSREVAIAKARTSNVSATGAFFELPEAIPLDVGTQLQVKIELPPELTPGLKRAELRGKATVVRLEGKSAGRGKRGVALKFERRLDITFTK